MQESEEVPRLERNGEVLFDIAAEVSDGMMSSVFLCRTLRFSKKGSLKHIYGDSVTVENVLRL